MIKPKTLKQIVQSFLDSEWAERIENDESVSGSGFVDYFTESGGMYWRLKEAIEINGDGITLTARELATVLFALRNLEEDMLGGKAEFMDKMKESEHFNGMRVPTETQIDELAEKLNFGGD